MKPFEVFTAEDVYKTTLAVFSPDTCERIATELNAILSERGKRVTFTFDEPGTEALLVGEREVENE